MPPAGPTFEQQALESELLALNRAFYDAFESLDLDRMRAVWTCTPDDICIHPGWEIYRGWADIQESWRAIFAGTGFMRFELTELVFQHRADLVQLTCIENIYSVTGPVAQHARVACTNLFVETEDGWRLTLHHGSPIASSLAHETPTEDQALN